jgi:ceramide glucosyltransferase
MVATAISALAATWWFCSIAVLLMSCLAAIARPKRQERNSASGDLPPLSAVVPVKDPHPGFHQALSSLFAQNYPGLEIIIAAAEGKSPAIEAAKEVQDAFPAVNSRVIRSICDGAVSPKLSNMWPALIAARNDLLLTMDSNLQLGAGELKALASRLVPGTGLVSSISIATHPRSFAAWIEASIINCYHARVLMLADATGHGFGLGKIMLFRRSDLIRAGGFERLAWALGEDQALAKAIGDLGLRTRLADGVSHQYLGNRRISEVWQRQLRWMIVWRTQLPAAFLGALMGSAIPTAAAGAVAAGAFGLAPMAVFGATLAGWLGLESVLCLANGWPISLWSPFAFLARELLTPLLWLRACSTSRVAWGGTIRSAAHSAGGLRASRGGSRPVAARSVEK